MKYLPSAFNKTRSSAEGLTKWTKRSNHLGNTSVWTQPLGRYAEIETAGSPSISSPFILFLENTINDGTCVPLAFIQVITMIRIPLSADVRDATALLPLTLLCLCCTAAISVPSTLTMLRDWWLTFFIKFSFINVKKKTCHVFWRKGFRSRSRDAFRSSHRQFWMPFLNFKAYWLRDAPAGLTFNRCTLCPHCINLLKPNDIYIYMSYRSANPQTLHFKYLFNKYTYWIF